MKTSLAFILGMLAAPLFSAQLPYPYETINVLPENPFSYYGNANQIQEIFDKNMIQVALEVGSWIGGGSTKHMGELLKKKQGILYAVDHWLGSTTQQLNQVHWQPELQYVYQQFLSNMIHWDLTDVVIPCRMSSMEAAQALNVKPDLVYIDAEHEANDVYIDITIWYPLVKGRGILCGDDWNYGGVKAAVLRFAEENHLRIEAKDNFWRYHEN